MKVRTYSTGETARMLGISVDAVQRLCVAGKLRAKRVDNRWRISRRDIERRIQFKRGRLE